MKKISKDVITLPKETTVDFLKEPEVTFVSLVRHGANNTPFRVVKGNKGEKMNKVVQAIRIEKDSKADLETLIGKDFRKDTVEKDDNYLIYEQVDKSACALDTKSVVAIDPENHVYAITYDLLVDEKEKGKKNLSDPPKTIVLKEDIKELDSWDVWSEMYAMMDLISGSMSQSNMKESDMKSTVLLAIDNFRSFCETIFSEAKSNGTPPVGERAAKFIEMLQKQIPIKKTNKEGTMFELESKEELTGIIADVVTKAITQKTEEDAKSAETQAAAKTAEDERLAKEKEIEGLKTSMKEVNEKLEKLSGTVVSKTVVDDPDNPDTLKKENVYSGLFTKKGTHPGVSGLE